MEYRLIGKIIKPFGLKGDVKIETYTDFIDDRFKNGSSVYLDINGFKKEFTVLRHRMHKNQLLVAFKDFEDINMIEKYKGVEIFKNTDDIKPLKEGEYYFDEIIGLDIYINGIKEGVVKDMEEGVIYNFMRIIKNDHKEVLVPFLDKFVQDVKLNEKRIDLYDIEGLIWK